MFRPGVRSWKRSKGRRPRLTSGLTRKRPRNFCSSGVERSEPSSGRKSSNRKYPTPQCSLNLPRKMKLH
jgi:hypothetical protein